MTTDRRKCFLPTCSEVETEGKKFMRCTRCKINVYCSPVCQRKHWAEHKHACKAPGEAKPPAPAPAPAPVPAPAAAESAAEAEEQTGEVEDGAEIDLGDNGAIDTAGENYTRALQVFMERDGEAFLQRWAKMQIPMRINVIDVTFDAMLNHTTTNTTGFKLSKEHYFALCPEIAPPARLELAKSGDAFPKLVKKVMKRTHASAMELMRKRRSELQEVSIHCGRQLQYEIVIGDEEAEGSLQFFGAVYRLLIAETLVCVFEAMVGRKAAEMEHMRGHRPEQPPGATDIDPAAPATADEID